MVAPIKVIILKETLHKANLFLEDPKEVAVTFDVACQSQQQLWRQIAAIHRKIMRQIRGIAKLNLRTIHYTRWDIANWSFYHCAQIP